MQRPKMDPTSRDAAAATLLGLLLRPPTPSSAENGGAGARLLRSYVNALLWFALIAVTAALLLRLAKLVRLWILGGRIPGPKSNPFFGHTKVLAGCGSGENLTGCLEELHRSYGPVVRLWLSPTQLLVSVRDAALIEDVLVKAEDKLPLTGRAFGLAFGRRSLFVSDFGKVQRRREFLAGYINGKLVERASTVAQKVADCVMGRVDSLMTKGLLDCRSVSQHLAFYFLGSTLFGDAFLDWSQASTYEELLLTIAKDGCFWATYSIPPFWRKSYWNYQSICRRLKCLTEDIITHCKKNCPLLNQSDNNIKGHSMKDESLLDSSALHGGGIMSSNSMEEDIKTHLITRDEPFGNILSLMFHGCLATTSLISTILTKLVLHPELQEKLYAEVVAVCGRTGRLDEDDVQKMHLLLATIYESARLLPAGPLLQRCSLNHDMLLNSSVIPAGAMLVVPLQLVQMDDSVWGGDASQFNPHRFLSTVTDPSDRREESDDSLKYPFPREPVRKSSFLSFGSGARACVAPKFASLGISAIIAFFIQNYEIRPRPGSETDPQPVMSDCILQLLPSPKITFVKREK